MPKKSSKPESLADHLMLVISHDEAIKKIEERITKGKAIKELPVKSSENLEEAKKEYRKWTDYNSELLKRIFSTDEIAKEYEKRVGLFIIQPATEQPLSEKINKFYSTLGEKNHRLESICERIELIPVSDDTKIEIEKESAVKNNLKNPKVFLVHGHDNAARETVARFIEKIKLNPIILHEQPNAGRTLIEKLEHNAEVGFAIVILTPDDEGRVKLQDEKLRDRARQNVILELGYFVGKLGRNRVCALHKGSVEIPSDYLGVLFVSMDDAGGWQLKLAKELKEAGFFVDMNKVV